MTNVNTNRPGVAVNDGCCCVAVLPEDALHKAAEVGADVLPPRPVDGQVGPHGLDQLAGDVPQRLVAEHLHRAVVDVERVVERQLVVG